MVAHTLMHIVEGHDDVAFIEIAGGGPLPRVGDRISVRGGRYVVEEVLHKFGDDSILSKAYVEIYVEPVANRNKLITHDPAEFEERLSRSDI